MVVRIRLGRGLRVQKKARKNQQLALAFAALLQPSALMALVLAVWAIASDMKLSGDFPVHKGALSDWRFWLCAAFGIGALSATLNRYGLAAKEQIEL